ncbi:MAG: MarR family winged helix-turn-helix transcriptional regulator [Ktedonobacterales bacterium]
MNPNMPEISSDAARAGGELRALVGRLSRRLRQARTEDEITLSQISVLKRLERGGPASTGMLAAAERVRPQSMGATLASLERLGMISRHRDPTDARSALLELTPAGKQALEGVRHNRDELLARALADGFSAAEQQALIAVLPLLDRLAQML